jgi:hypothetical protein
MCGLVRRRGLEPLCLAALAPQASASANFATSAYLDAVSARCGEQSEAKYTISIGLDEGTYAQDSVQDGSGNWMELFALRG